MRQGIRKAQVDTANSRQKRRRQALLALNVLAAEVGYAAKPLSFKRAAHSHVEHRVRALERRCLSDDLHHRLLAAARLYTENGGRFSVDVRPKDSDPMSDVSLVAKHKVLRGNFRLHSEAFMLTYHSDSFTEATWVEFLADGTERSDWLGGTASTDDQAEQTTRTGLTSQTKRHDGRDGQEKRAGGTHGTHRKASLGIWTDFRTCLIQTGANYRSRFQPSLDTGRAEAPHGAW